MNITLQRPKVPEYFATRRFCTKLWFFSQTIASETGAATLPTITRIDNAMPLVPTTIPDICVHLLALSPHPIWLVEMEGSLGGHRPPFDDVKFQMEIGKHAFGDRRALLGCKFRSVDLSRLLAILQTGIDVEPPSAPIYLETFEKAWDYGGFPKVTLALDYNFLDQTYRVVPADTPADKLTELELTFPTRMLVQHGTKYWFSRLASTDRRLNTPYEASFAKWIPGDATKALRGVMIFAKVDDGTIEDIYTAMEDCGIKSLNSDEE